MLKGKLHLYFIKKPLNDRWFYGDRYFRIVFNLLFKKKKTSSLELVFQNLCKGLTLLGIKYDVNRPFPVIQPTDQVVVLGSGPHALKGYHQPNKIVAGIGLMTHPANWPDLFKSYPIAVYLQHSEWTAAIYNKWYGSGSCKIWPSGIDTDFWKPTAQPKTSLLVYVKFLWNKEANKQEILAPILTYLKNKNLAYQLIEYGKYELEEYKMLLNSSLGMIFLCEHESQGLAYQEAMAMDVPIFAWDQGLWLDQNRSTWGETTPVMASSVPYFEESCGEKFKNLEEFEAKFPLFYQNAQQHYYHPRSYVLENLTLKKSAERMVEILKETYS